MSACNCKTTQLVTLLANVVREIKHEMHLTRPSTSNEGSAFLEKQFRCEGDAYIQLQLQEVMGHKGLVRGRPLLPDLGSEVGLQLLRAADGLKSRFSKQPDWNIKMEL